MANRNIVITNNARSFKSALQKSLYFSFLILYIMADMISFLEIQRLQLAGSSSTVFAVYLILRKTPVRRSNKLSYEAIDSPIVF